MSKYCVLIFLSFPACQTGVDTSDLRNVGTGVILSEAKDKIVEVFTPEYPLYIYPISICGLLDNNKVKCVITPCKAHCSIHYDSPEEFLATETAWSLLPLTIKQYKSAVEFCKANKSACVEKIPEFQDKTIVFTQERR